MWYPLRRSLTFPNTISTTKFRSILHKWGGIAIEASKKVKLTLDFSIKYHSIVS